MTHTEFSPFWELTESVALEGLQLGLGLGLGLTESVALEGLVEFSVGYPTLAICRYHFDDIAPPPFKHLSECLGTFRSFDSLLEAILEFLSRKRASN